MQGVEKNPLAYKPVGNLLKSLAVPSIVANVVNALYNIIDQIFIGQGVGTLGNAATSIAFPITTISLAIGLMVGIGSSAGFGLELGRGNQEKAKHIVGTGSSSLFLLGLSLAVVVLAFLDPLLRLFGATEAILPYAETYAGITAFGLPFFLFSLGVNPLVRADHSPKYSMMAIIIGAVINTILDPIFIFVLDWGMAGAAWATVISQFISALMLLAYLPKFKSVKLSREDFKPRLSLLRLICQLGLNSFIFQFSNVLVQIALNNVLRHYGALSPYGADIPIAVAGIVTKVNVMYIALIIGLSNGVQPIASYNYGAKQYERVKEVVHLFMKVSFSISFVMWSIFELFPRQILSLFGSSNQEALYLEYAVPFMRVYLFFILVNGMQICISNFLSAIGKANQGAFLSFTKQILILLPLLILLPIFFGLNGIMFAQPITDLLSFLMAIIVLNKILKQLDQA